MTKQSHNASQNSKMALHDILRLRKQACDRLFSGVSNLFSLDLAYSDEMPEIFSSTLKIAINAINTMNAEPAPP